jgi:RNA polymerase sigma factor (sigma-70 family)
MATAQMDTVIRHLRRAVLRQDAAARTDGQLLASFIDEKDEAAFEALVRRHGSMVFGVCRRVVRNHHDAEDAFQATFLVLARKASSVRPRERLANWLHGVALRAAMKAKTTIAKRRGREKSVTNMPEPETVQQDQWRDLHSLLDQELNGLPENYRLPILLCDLEGRSIKEATQQLGWPQGTLAGRLARGRKLLAKRLASRGVMLSAGSLAAVVAQNATSAAVPTSLLSSTVKAAVIMAAGKTAVAGAVPAQVALLMDGVMKAMLIVKLKTIAAAVLVIATVGISGGSLCRSTTMAAQTADERCPQMAGNQQPSQTRTGSLLFGVGVNSEAGLSSSVTLNERSFDIATVAVNQRELETGLQVGGNPREYKAFFSKALGVMGEYFEQITYANQYDGRIEASTVPVKDQTAAIRRGVINISASQEGGFSISVRVYKAIAEGTESRPAGRDAELERVIMRRLNVHPNQDEKSAVGKSAGPTKAKLIPMDRRDEGNTDLNRLQGVWSAVSIQQPGRKPSKLSKDIFFMVDGKRACWQATDWEMEGGLYLDPTRKPRTYDLATSTRTIEGIYSLEGDTLQLCYDMGTESKRPSAFTTEKEGQGVLVVLKRTYGPEVFPFRLADGTRAFPKIIEMTKTAPPPMAPQPPASRTPSYGEVAGEQPNKTMTYRRNRPTKAADRREYVIISKLMEAGVDQPREVLGLPKLTLDDGQFAPLHILDAPQNLLATVVEDEHIKIGTFFDVRVKRLGANKVRLTFSFQKNEVEDSGISEIRVLGTSVQAIHDVELHKPVKFVLQKDARGATRRWVEITVDEQTIPAGADNEKARAPAHR